MLDHKAGAHLLCCRWLCLVSGQERAHATAAVCSSKPVLTALPACCIPCCSQGRGRSHARGECQNCAHPVPGTLQSSSVMWPGLLIGICGCLLRALLPASSECLQGMVPGLLSSAAIHCLPADLAAQYGHREQSGRFSMCPQLCVVGCLSCPAIHCLPADLAAQDGHREQRDHLRLRPDGPHPQSEF